MKLVSFAAASWRAHLLSKFLFSLLACQYIKVKMLVLCIIILVRVSKVISTHEETMKTFSPQVYFENIRNSRGLDTTIDPLFLASRLAVTIDQQASTIDQQASTIKEIDRKYYVMQCGQEQRYAVEYFEKIFTDAATLNLPDLMNLRSTVKNQSFISHISTNPTIHISSTCSGKFNNFNATLQTKYREMYIASRLTQAEKWTLIPQWLATSDEYKQVSNGDKILRLEKLVQAIRSQLRQDSLLTTDLITACVLNNWPRLCDICKVSPKSFNYTDVLEKFFILGRNKPETQIAKYCIFLLQNIIEEIPLSTAEKEALKHWTNESEIAIESWELDVNRPMRGPRTGPPPVTV